MSMMKGIVEDVCTIVGINIPAGIFIPNVTIVLQTSDIHPREEGRGEIQ